MIKENKIKELIYGKVGNLLDEETKKHGFKYFKSKGYFLRKVGEFEQFIHLKKPYSALSFNEDTDQLFLAFDLYTEIKMPEYEKWHKEKIRSNSNFSLHPDYISSQMELSFYDFESADVYTPTASQQFKRNIAASISSIVNDDDDSKIIPFNELLENKIADLISNLSENSNILKIFEIRKHPLQHTYLLVYGGLTDLANEQLEKVYQFYIEKIETELKVSDNAIRQIEDLDKFILEAQTISEKRFSNPYKAERSVKILPTQNDIFEFSEKNRFQEVLRLDVSQYDMYHAHHSINANGDIILLANYKKIIKLNSKGEKVFETEIEIKPGFQSLNGPVEFGVIKETDEFYINNYIVSNDNQLIELALPSQELKKDKLQNSRILSFAYYQKENQYLVLYERLFLKYDRNGALKESLDLKGYSTSNIIIVEKEWIISQNLESNMILDFNGNKIGSYEYGNGNTNFEFSPLYDSAIFFFYATKSQFYNLNSGTKDVLWAHPTYIKDYKEKLYNDINQNFGLTIAKYSPDNKYIVGGADHGKYVAWTLPKKERIELIPQQEMIDLLETDYRTLPTGEREEIKAEIVVLDNVSFLKNRGNEISKIIFFENGDVFITELGYGKFVLALDRNFKNLMYKKIDGRLNYHSQRYLTQINTKEIIIYK